MARSVLLFVGLLLALSMVAVTGAQPVETANDSGLVIDGEMGNLLQITMDTAEQRNPSISGDRIVWEDNISGTWTIPLYTISTETQIIIQNYTLEAADYARPKISGDNVIWVKPLPTDYVIVNSTGRVVSDVDNYLIYWYNIPTGNLSPLRDRGLQVDQIYREANPAIEGAYVVYSERTDLSRDPALIFYDLTTGEEQRITSQPNIGGTDISGKLIVWEDGCIGGPNCTTRSYVFNTITGEKRRLFANDATFQTSPKVSGSWITWMEMNETDPQKEDMNVYLLDTTSQKVFQITSTAKDLGIGREGQLYAISEGNLVWFDDRARDKNYDIYLYNITTRSETLLVGNASYMGDYSTHVDTAIDIDGRRIVWSGYSPDDISDIYLFTLSEPVVQGNDETPSATPTTVPITASTPVTGSNQSFTSIPSVNNSPSLDRPATGTIVSGSQPWYGMGELTIDNINGTYDGVAILTQSGSLTPVIAVYIQRGEIYTIDGIQDGVYDLYFTLGGAWDSNSKQFTVNASQELFVEPLEFDTYTTNDGDSTTTHYMTFTITLYPVDEGGGETKPVETMPSL